MLQELYFWLRESVGMGKASVAVRKSRRVSAINVYTQRRMKGFGVKIGSLEYKEKQREICESWSRLTDVEREVYERMAAEQSADRKRSATVSLAEQEAAEVEQDAEVLPLVCKIMWFIYFTLLYLERWSKFLMVIHLEIGQHDSTEGSLLT